MKLAKKAFIIALTMLALVFAMSAQTLRSTDDDRNIAPTAGTGGAPGGPTGLFTIYDGQTLRKGEFTFSAAYSNYDRDPGNVDITEVPVSFQIGLSDNLELFFNTDALRRIKVNSPRNLSGFYLPNSKVRIGNAFVSPPAIILAPRGPGATQFPGSVFRPQGAPFTQFPYVGGFLGNFGLFFPSGPIFGFPAGSFPRISAPIAGGNGADNFPGIGSVFGGILPGIVLSTANLGGNCTAQPNNPACFGPSVFTLAPSYLPDAPLLNRTYGESAFSTFTVGGKWRWTGPSNPIGVGIVAFYRFYADTANDFSGFNQLQRGASAGGNKGDIGLVLFGDARLRKWINVSANLGYIYNGSIKSDAFGTEVTLLDRPDEVIAGIGVDFPVNRFFQPIMEFKTTQYVGGRTPNAFENSPMEGLIGARIFPTRWFSLGGWYRHHFNQQDQDSFEEANFQGTVNIAGAVPQTIVTNFRGVPTGFVTSNDPHGFGFQITVGRRNERAGPIINIPPSVDSVTLGERRVTTPCPPNTRPREGQNCTDDMTVSVATRASDKENDPLTYSYTVSGGRIVGNGANVSWDLTGVQPGSYTVTVGVDDGCGICGPTKTETIVVERCDCVPVCVCPTLSVQGPSGVTEPGQPMTFTANVSGGGGDVMYSWRVTRNGEAVNFSGDGTPVITVQTDRSWADTNVTAEVTISGAGLCADCPRIDDETAPIAPLPRAVLIDTCKANDTPRCLTDDDIKARVDAFYIELNNNPNDVGYIITYGTPKEIARREAQIRKAIKFRKYDGSRVVFVQGGNTGEGAVTRFWRVPPGANPPDAAEYTGGN